ncbi:MAG: DUF4293 family protein [Ilyomonas sp.]
MIQRVQTIWLLLASLFAFLTLKFPFYIIAGTLGLSAPIEFNATSRTFLLMLTSILGALCFIIIFLFKQRKLQMKLCLLSLLISLVNIYLYFNFIKEYTVGGLSIFSVFTFLIPVFILLAIRGIYKDQKLIRSVDRIR